MASDNCLPGRRLRRLVEKVFDTDTVERILLPALDDLQHECTNSASRIVWLRAHWGVLKAIALLTVGAGYRQALPTTTSVTRRMAIILPLMTLGVWRVASHSPADDLAPGTLLTFLPQAFGVSLLLAYYVAVTLEQWPVSPRRLLPGICALSVALTLVMLILTMSIMPKANQTFRTAVSDHLRANGRPAAVALGPSEWTFTELISRAASTSADRQAARQQLSGRLAASTLPIMIGFVALGISGLPKQIALFSGAWVLMLYIAALRAAAPSPYHAPALSNVWLVNVVFALGGLWLVWIRPGPGDQGHPHHIDPV